MNQTADQAAPAITNEERQYREDSLLSAIEWYTHTEAYSDQWKTDLYHLKEMLAELIQEGRRLTKPETAASERD